MNIPLLQQLALVNTIVTRRMSSMSSSSSSLVGSGEGIEMIYDKKGGRMKFSDGDNYLLPIESACDDCMDLGEYGTMHLIYASLKKTTTTPIQVVGMKKEAITSTLLRSKFDDNDGMMAKDLIAVRVSMRLPSSTASYHDMLTNRDVPCVIVTKAAYEKSVIVPGEHPNRLR